MANEIGNHTPSVPLPNAEHSENIADNALAQPQQKSSAGALKRYELKDWIGIGGLFFAAISLITSATTFRYTSMWNPKKSSHDTLLSMVEIGRFPELADKFHGIVPEKDWVDPTKTYANLSVEDQHKIDRPLWNILDILEALSINVNSGTLDENIAYDYLVLYANRYYEWSKPFIEIRRKTHHEEKLFENLEHLVERWEMRREREKRANQLQATP